MMNFKKDDISIDNILTNNIFNHNIKLKELDILFKKIEDDN